MVLIIILSKATLLVMWWAELEGGGKVARHYVKSLSCEDHKGSSVKTSLFNKARNDPLWSFTAIMNTLNVLGRNLVPLISFRCFSVWPTQIQLNSIQKLTVAQVIQSCLLLWYPSVYYLACHWYLSSASWILSTTCLHLSFRPRLLFLPTQILSMFQAFLFKLCAYLSSLPYNPRISPSLGSLP